MSSDSDSSDDEEHMQRLRDAVVPVSCLPVGGFVAASKSEESEHELQPAKVSSSNGAPSFKKDEQMALTSVDVKKQSHASKTSSLPSIRKRIYDDLEGGHKLGFGLDAGARDRIARTLQKALLSDMDECDAFTIAGKVNTEDDSGVRLFRKSPLVGASSDQLASKPCGKSHGAGDEKKKKKKTRNYSSSDSDSDNEAKMADLASVAVTADTIKLNSLTNGNINPSNKIDKEHAELSSSKDFAAGDFSSDFAHSTKKRKKRKKTMSKTNNISDVT